GELEVVEFDDQLFDANWIRGRLDAQLVAEEWDRLVRHVREGPDRPVRGRAVGPGQVVPERRGLPGRLLLRPQVPQIADAVVRPARQSAAVAAESDSVDVALMPASLPDLLPGLRVPHIHLTVRVPGR